LIQLPLSLPAIRVLGDPKSEGKIFPMITESILTIHIPRWGSKARIRKHITFHCFRHTFAMQLLDKGVDIYTIAALLGHKQVSSTQNYAKMSSKKMIEAIVKME
jgi:site-specific recombinase XerD